MLKSAGQGLCSDSSPWLAEPACSQCLPLVSPSMCVPICSPKDISRIASGPTSSLILAHDLFNDPVCRCSHVLS